MKLKITVCHSILSYCFANINPLDQGNPALSILAEIDRNTVLINDDLEVAYEIFFEEKHPELLANYQMWLSNKALYANATKIVSSNLNSHSITALTTDDYLEILLNLTIIGEDKVVFSDLLTTMDNSLAALKILQMNQIRILNRSQSNYYNSYRFPILRKRVENGDSATDLSNWLARIIKTETDITIIDPYIYSSVGNLKMLFLSHVPNGATIKIYTALYHTRVGSRRRMLTNGDLITEFSHTDYAAWNMEVYVIPTQGQHARCILTNNYFIHLEKGLAIFGNGISAAQSMINVDFIQNVESTALPAATQIL